MKILTELNNIKSSSLPTPAKWQAILDIDTAGRPGAAVVRLEQEKITKKLRDIRAKWQFASARNQKEWPICGRINAITAWKSHNHEARKAEFERKTKVLEAKKIYDAENERLSFAYELIGFKFSPSWAKLKPNQVKIQNLSLGLSFALINGWVITAKETIHWNNHKYSKSWHRRYGGAKEVESREVIFRKKQDGEITTRVVPVSSWAGNWAINACLEAGVIEPVKVPAKLKSVQLNKAFGVEKLRSVGSVEFYQRTLAGELVDYCAVYQGTTFHADTKLAAVQGLHEKIKAATKKKNEPITWKLCKSLGFCDTGLTEFCSEFGLDKDGSYSPSFIEKLVKADLKKASRFEKELRTLAAAFNHPITL